MRLSTKVAWVESAGNTKARLQIARPEAVKNVTVMVSRLKRLEFHVWLRYDRHSLVFVLRVVCKVIVDIRAKCGVIDCGRFG